MKLTHSTKNSAGIGLIEVLVTAVVVSLGLLGVASLQGNLIVGSRANKTRAEANALAYNKIEELRDTIEKTGTSGYDALLNATGSPFSDPNNPISGTTGQFNRSWAITDQTGPARKQISVTVCWPSAACTDQVVVQSVIAFDGVGNSVLAANGAGSGAGIMAGGASLNAGSSTDISQTIALPAAAASGSLVNINGKNYIVDTSVNGTGTSSQGLYTNGCNSYNPPLVAFENGLYTRRVDYDGVPGNEAIELYEQVVINAQSFCTPRIRYNGGVIIPIRGIVHSGATTGSGNNQTLLGVNLFTFNASETGAYCFFKPEVNAKSAPYVCYVGGNCQFGPNGTDTSLPVTECPNPAVAAASVGPGGWRGKVGLLGVAANGNNVCFAEEMAGSPVTLDTARNYYTLNNGLNEGINKPYSCHDFLIINGQTTEAKVHNECVTQANAIGGFSLASKNIERDISGSNVFDPVIDTSYCIGTTGTAYTITGTITGATAPTVTVSDGASTNPCTATSSSYTCNITTSVTSVTISGVYNSQPVSCNVTLSLTTPSTSGCSLIFTVLPTYTITGHISATTAAAANAISLTIQDGSNTANCTANNDYNNTYKTYTCLISTSSTTGITINATAANGYTVSPATYAVPTLSGITSTIVVPTPANDFVASVIPTHRIYGSIILGGNISGTLSVTDAVLLGNCGTAANGDGLSPPSGGWKKSKTGSYQCTFEQNSTNSFSLAISPTNNAGVNYILTASPTTRVTSAVGQLVIDLSNVSSDQPYNITIN
ncbi:MAG: hypothetical protein PHY54_09375 [Methylococcales bacterium]|nr:hypothetical protein [Methylococcales bacterium]